MTADQPTVALGHVLTIAGLEAIATRAAWPVLAEAARTRIAQGRAVVDRVVDEGITAYGINTGVGSQKDFAVRSRHHRRL